MILEDNELFLIDGEETLKLNCDDKGIMGLVEQLRIVDIYVDFLDINHEKNMFDALMFDSENDSELDLGRIIRGIILGNRVKMMKIG